MKGLAVNQRAFGPCYDTDVDLELVEKGMITFLGCKASDTERPGTGNTK